MAKISAGILPYRFSGEALQVFLVHPGGPFWKNQDEGAWMIAKGEVEEGEDLLPAARREFEEETGCQLGGTFTRLEPIRQKGGKMVYAFICEAQLDVREVRSQAFTLEWPPRSGQMQSFPEVDRAEWMDLDMARKKILPSQLPLLDQLSAAL